MDIDPGGMCHLNTLEETHTGLQSPVHISEIDCFDLCDQLMADEAGVEARRAADDDEITHSERAAIGPDMVRLRVKKQIIAEIAAQITAYQIDHPQAS